MTPGCSIVIRAFNEGKYIERLLLGIIQQTIKDIQIILVDSGSTDETTLIASRYPVEIMTIRPEEFTFGRSLNFGILHASYPLVVIVSAHVYPVYPDWLERLLEPFIDPNVALTYGKQRGDQSTRFSEHQLFMRLFPENSTGKQTHPFCNNANAAIRRSLWERQSYNELLPGLEDLAWAKWTQEQGYATYYAAAAEVIHVHNETLKGLYNRYRREGMAFKAIYPHEQFTLIEFFRTYFHNVRSDYQAARQLKVAHTVWKDILSFRLLQLWGTYQGYKKTGPLTRQLKQAFYYPNQDALTLKPVTRSLEPIPYSELKKQADNNKDLSL